jgi:hypothetical protein
MSQNEEIAGEGDNAGPLTREKLERELGKFGKAYGQGLNSRPAAALICVDAANRLKDVGADDAEELYRKFASAASKAKGIEYSAVKSEKVQVSKLKRFLMVGQLPAIDGVEVMNRVCDTIENLSNRIENPLKGSAYDNMVLAARRQIEQPTKALTDEEIEEILTESTPEKTALDMVIGAYKAAYRLEEKLKDAGVDPSLMTSCEQATLDYAEQIKALDGELPPMTKDEKQLAKAQEVIRKAGGTASFATVEAPVMQVADPNFQIVGRIANG